jgi:cobalt-zinc-cadmium efflux system outer membrane protein
MAFISGHGITAWALVRFTLILALAGTVLPALGDNSTPSMPILTLDQAYTMALQNNLKIKAARAQIPEAQADVIIAKVRPNPSLNTDLGLIAEKTYRIAGLEETFEPPGKRKFRVRVARDQLAQSQATYEQTVFETLTQVRQAYTNWIAALNRSQLQQDNLEVLQSLAEIAQKRFQLGDVPELDVIQAKMLVTQAQSDLELSQSEALQSKTRLSEFLNTPSFLPPPGSLFQSQVDAALVQVLPPLETLQTASLQNRKDLQVNTAALQAEKDRLRLFHRSIVPDLTLQSGYDLVNNPPTWISGLYITGKVDIPVFDHQQGNIAKSKAAYHRLLAEREALKLNILTNVDAAYQKAQAQQAQWQRFRQTVLPGAMQVERLSQRSYEMGQTGIGEALIAHQNTLSVRQKAVQAFTDYQLALSDLEASLGRRLNEVNAP